MKTKTSFTAAARGVHAASASELNGGFDLDSTRPSLRAVKRRERRAPGLQSLRSGFAQRIRILGTLAVLGLLTLRGSAQLTVDTVLATGLFEPYAVAVDSQDVVYITDSANHRVVRYDPNTGLSTTVAGIPGESGSNDGPVYLAHLNAPQGIALATVGGVSGLVVGDTGNHLIRFVNLGNNTVTTLAGTAGVAGNLDAVVGTNAKFRFPMGLAVDNAGILCIADSKNNQIRQINLADANSPVTTLTVAGTTFREPNALAVLSTNRLWVADTRNHAIKLVTRTGFTSAVLTTLMGGNDQNLSGSADNSFGASARFNNPRGLLWLGAAGLVIADTGNQTIRLATNNPVFGTTNYGVVTLAGTAGQSGFVNGPAAAAKFSGPHGLARDALGSGFMIADLANNAIRRIQTGPTQPPVAPPQIGWVDFVLDQFGALVSVLRTDQPFVFNNDVVIAVLAEAGTETFFTFGPTPPSPIEDTIPSPNQLTGSTPPHYEDGLHPSEVPPSMVLPQPDLTIKVMSRQDGRQSSSVVQARFQFKVANPTVSGENAAGFAVTGQTVDATMWYTIDGTEPTDGAPSLGPIVTNTTTLSFDPGSNDLTFKIRAFRDHYKSSSTVTKVFSPTNFIPNRISFGFASGEASSDFIASPGQLFYAPVTLSPLPGTAIYSLQFNLSVTNAGPNPGPPVALGDVGFQSFLQKPLPGNASLFEIIPPLSFSGYQAAPPPASSIVIYDGMPFVDMTFLETNQNFNLLGIGWLERYGETNLYNTKQQDLIKYSQPHDTQFLKEKGSVVLGGYGFLIPGCATNGQTYRIQIGRPSATSDGIGAPGSEVHIGTPTNGSLTAGGLNAIKLVTTGQRRYVVGDVYPFRWFNAGDFGKGQVANADVMQVFQSGIYSLNSPPEGSDFFDAMDSCGFTYGDSGFGYLTNSYVGPGDLNPLFDGNDTNINQIAFGDGNLDVCDVYVTFRRSLDSSLLTFRRFWTNTACKAFRAAEVVGNAPLPGRLSRVASVNPPSAKFASSDTVATAGQTLQIPITATISGDYPLRTLMLNLSVNPLDGSPALTSPLQFTPNPTLGSPLLTDSKGNANYAATWLNVTGPGLTGEVTLGTVTVQLPASAGGSAAYAVHFDHASASPNGLASFPKQTQTGLITLSDRSASSWNDGIPDAWRLRYFGSIKNVLSAASADADGDGANNLHELKAGTDPNDASSVLRLTSNASQFQAFVVRWPSISGKQYIIERATSLYSPAWTPISTNSGTGLELEYHDPVAGSTARFYRVRVLE